MWNDSFDGPRDAEFGKFHQILTGVFGPFGGSTVGQKPPNRPPSTFVLLLASGTKGPVVPDRELTSAGEDEQTEGGEQHHQ